jgi:hypothetical protein
MSKGRNTTVVGCRVNDSVYTMVKAEADKQGLNINDWLKAIINDSVNTMSLKSNINHSVNTIKPKLDIKDSVNTSNIGMPVKPEKIEANIWNEMVRRANKEGVPVTDWAFGYAQTRLRGKMSAKGHK